MKTRRPKGWVPTSALCQLRITIDQLSASNQALTLENGELRQRAQIEQHRADTLAQSLDRMSEKHTHAFDEVQRLKSALNKANDWQHRFDSLLRVLDK